MYRVPARSTVFPVRPADRRPDSRRCEAGRRWTVRLVTRPVSGSSSSSSSTNFIAASLETKLQGRYVSRITLQLVTPRLWTASCVNRDVHCSADGPRAATDCMTDCGSRPDCSCSSILTNQSADERYGRVRCIRAFRPYLGSYYWQLFNNQPDLTH